MAVDIKEGVCVCVLHVHANASEALGENDQSRRRVDGGSSVLPSLYSRPSSAFVPGSNIKGPRCR